MHSFIHSFVRSGHDVDVESDARVLVRQPGRPADDAAHQKDVTENPRDARQGRAHGKQRHRLQRHRLQRHRLKRQFDQRLSRLKKQKNLRIINKKCN